MGLSNAVSGTVGALAPEGLVLFAVEPAGG